MTIGTLAVTVAIVAVVAAVVALVDRLKDRSISQPPRALDQIRDLDYGRNLSEANPYFTGRYCRSTAMAAAHIPDPEKNRAATFQRPAP